VKKVELFTRQGCHLCDVAYEVVARVREREPFELTTVDVDTDPALAKEYGWDVPVVVVDGIRHAKYHVDEEAFLKRLRA
jgi:glutaredoxin